MPDRPRSVYRAGRVLIDLAAADLRGPDGQSLKAPPKVAQLLLFLAERCGRVVSREEILAGVWPGRVVEPNALNQVISQARQLLGNEGRAALVTHAKRGFQLCADEVEAETAQTHALPGPRETSPDDDAKPAVASVAPPAVAPKTPVEPTPRRGPSSLALAALALALAVVGGMLLWRSAPEVAPAAPHLRLDPALPEALVALLTVAAAEAGWRVGEGGTSGTLAPGDIALRATASADGVLWVEAAGTRAVLPHALLPELLPRLNPEAAIATVEDRSDRLDALFVPGTDFATLVAALNARLAAHPESRSAWRDLKRLAQLGGKADLAAFLDIEALRGDGPVAGTAAEAGSADGKAARLQALFDATGHEPDAAVAVQGLTRGCAPDRVAPDSWAAGACALELALAQLRARDFSNYAGHLALAASAFREAGDSRSAELADYLRGMLSSDYSGAINVEAVGRLSDSRAIGLVLRPLAVQNPALAYPLGEAILDSPWIDTRPVEKTDVLMAMGWAARLADDPAILARFSTFLDAQLARPEPAVPADFLRALRMQVAANEDDVGKALALRREIVEWRFPAMRCQTYGPLISAGDSDLALQDATECASRREEPSYRANMGGFVGWVAKIATLRFRGDDDAALSQLRAAVDAFASQPSDQLNYPLIASGLFMQAWAMRQPDLAEAVCRASPVARAVCDGDDLQTLLVADRAPSTLPMQQFVPPEYRELVPGSFRLELYLEQQRTGVCTLPRPESERLRASFDARGNVVMRDFLAAIEDDCAAGRRSAFLDGWRSREYAY